jgi:hypothetical protein
MIIMAYLIYILGALYFHFWHLFDFQDSTTPTYSGGARPKNKV